MALRTDTQRAFSCWASGSRKVCGDPLWKALCFSAGVGGNEHRTRQEQSKGGFTGITAAVTQFVLQRSVKFCSYERHLSCVAQALQVNDGPMGPICSLLSTWLYSFSIYYPDTPEHELASNNCLEFPVSAVFCQGFQDNLRCKTRTTWDLNFNSQSVKYS